MKLDDLDEVMTRVLVYSLVLAASALVIGLAIMFVAWALR